MQVRKSELGVAVYLAPDGPLIEDNLPALRESVPLISPDGPVHIVIDLKRVPLFDSALLEYLFDLSTELREAGGSLSFANATSVCRDVLGATRLSETIPVFEDLESAGRSFL